ncbi:MAG: serine/threonine-protein phosphatase, partial [Trichodesmium sp. St16_bin2-tuft]|nr:serine/threonine-protein phosphatase [Trichodesmium sp. St16_bin2-tuft]
LGHCLHWQALERRDSGALTQALGTKNGEFIRPTIQRFLIEEEGLLLLCSDGLSDNNWVENSWAEYTPKIFRGEISLKEGVESLIELANQKNGHDNTSVVLVHYRISLEKLILFNIPTATTPVREAVITELSEASKELLYSNDEEVLEPESKAELKPVQDFLWLKPWMFMISLLLILLVGAIISVWRNWENFRSTPGNPSEPWQSPMIPEPSRNQVPPNS